MRTLIVSLLLAGVAVTALTAGADAQTRRRVRAPVVAATEDLGNGIPLTVNRRSWLDPGPVAPRGTGTNYMTANTSLNRTQDRIFSPDGFGNDVIRNPPDVPGRSRPVVEFSSLPNGGAQLDQVDIADQNYYFNPAPSLPAPAPAAPGVPELP